MKQQLVAMSHGKCFYCERKLLEDEYTVDHYIEVNERPELAHDWNNLYLCCHGCQNKLDEKTIARASCLDPCNPNIDPVAHLAFDDEVITARNGSQRGDATIRKYQLGRQALEYRRSKVLTRYHKLLIKIQQDMITEQRQRLTVEERDLLQRFGQPDQPFSAMFRDIELPG